MGLSLDIVCLSVDLDYLENYVRYYEVNGPWGLMEQMYHRDLKKAAEMARVLIAIYKKLVCFQPAWLNLNIMKRHRLGKEVKYLIKHIGFLKLMGLCYGIQYPNKSRPPATNNDSGSATHTRHQDQHHHHNMSSYYYHDHHDPCPCCSAFPYGYWRSNFRSHEPFPPFSQPKEVFQPEKWSSSRSI